MDLTTQAGIRKQSFALPYGGGTIWCEHLDSMGRQEQAVLDKLSGDAITFGRPSASSFMIINLDETLITDAILRHMEELFRSTGKRMMKIAIVGAPRNRHAGLRAALACTGAVITFFTDYEKAKEWMF